MWALLFLIYLCFNKLLEGQVADHVPWKRASIKMVTIINQDDTESEIFNPLPAQGKKHSDYHHDYYYYYNHYYKYHYLCYFFSLLVSQRSSPMLMSIHV